MSSPHYQVTSGGSVPSDYALLSRYAAHRNLEDEEPNEETPFLQNRPSKPSMASIPVSNENTPLINPRIPRIHEVADESEQDVGEVNMYWEEFRILTKYGLPVFGCVVLFESSLSFSHSVQNACAGIQSRHCLYPICRTHFHHCPCRYHARFHDRQRQRLLHHPGLRERTRYHASFGLDVNSAPARGLVVPAHE